MRRLLSLITAVAIAAAMFTLPPVLTGVEAQQHSGVPARDYGDQRVHFMRKTVAYNTTGIGTADTVYMATLPTGAFVLDVVVNIDTAFNAGTTNVLIVGTSDDDDEFVAAGDVNEAATGATRVTTGLGYKTTQAETIYVKFTETGTAATAGQATIVVAYVPDNDQ